MKVGWWLVVLLMLGGAFRMERPLADRGADAGGSVEAMDGGSGEPPPPR